MKRHLAYIIILLALLTACSEGGRRYKIGVSQCSDDIWREKQNSELRMGAYLHGDVDLRFAAADDSDERQVGQIDSLVQTGIDLLIVAPNQVQTISPAIDRAFDRGIPVIVFERKTSSQKYTAFISADNYEMGHVMGEHIARRLGGWGRVVEVMGLKGSSPAIDRHKGFVDAISGYPGIEIVATLQGDWTEQSGFEAMSSWLSGDGRKVLDHSSIDFVFGQNDRMAIGARKALTSYISPLTSKFCGIDGLPGEGGGIQLVCDSVLDATYIYPTHGDQLLDLALDILEGRPYKRESSMMSAIVTRDNAKAIQMQEEETLRQTAYLDQLHNKADGYLEQLSTQRMVSILAISLVILLMLVILFFYLYQMGKITLRRERVVNNLWNMESESPASLDQQPATPSEEPTPPDAPAPSEDLSPESDPIARSHFIARFKEVVERRLAESNLTVEDIAGDLGLSRVQLYRRVKNVTGSSPVELLRTARLNRGYQMLLSTDKTVAEVAYDVGFSAPSYFTKCFKEEFGMSPSDI